MIGSDIAAVDGGKAIKLDLPGSGIIPYIPWTALAIYITVVIITQKNKRRTIRVCGIIGGYVFALMISIFPNLVFNKFSTRIKTENWLQTADIEIFEREFYTPTIHINSSSTGGPWIVVPKRNFRPEMVVWIRELETNEVEQKAGKNASRLTP